MDVTRLSKLTVRAAAADECISFSTETCQEQLSLHPSFSAIIRSEEKSLMEQVGKKKEKKVRKKEQKKDED
jgi:ketol-acid reductoisomerase